MGYIGTKIHIFISKPPKLREKSPRIMPMTEQKITVQEFRRMNFEGEDAFFELINGVVVRRAAPSPYHQEISQNLNLAISLFVRSESLGKVFTAPTDVFLNDYNHVIPDIFFVSRENLGIVDYRHGIYGVPDLMVEIISPGSILQDRVEKRDAYQRASVREYWMVDMNNRSIEIYKNVEGEFRIASFAADTGVVLSEVLRGLEISINEVFG